MFKNNFFFTFYEIQHQKDNSLKGIYRRFYRLGISRNLSGFHTYFLLYRYDDASEI